MAKKDDTLDAWEYRYPSAGVSWNFIGDPAYCQQYVGEAKKLLYQLKNRMNLADPKLKTLQHVEPYGDGTIITVRSVFGQDFVEINASGGTSSCSITLLKVPTVIQPMRYPGIIGTGGIYNGPDPWGLWDGRHTDLEVEGVDYVKIYYTISRGNCASCSADLWSVCKAGKIPTGLGAKITCAPFIYDEKKIKLKRPFKFGGESLEHIPYLIIPPPANQALYLNDHCVYSFSGCQAEIIKFGTDSQGNYFILKAYTEWGLNGPLDVNFSRTGMGYMDLKAYIKGPDGAVLCQGEALIKVDCCAKKPEDRKIHSDTPRMSGLWWELDDHVPVQNCVNQPVLSFGSMALCEVPLIIDYARLWRMACIPVWQKNFYTLPEQHGNCGPFQWSDPIIPGGLLGEGGGWPCPKEPYDCNQRTTITVTDRCGTTVTVDAKSCCELLSDADQEVVISYTSLLMSCGQEQDFTAMGGCGPYVWSTSSGTITQAGHFTAPATNPGCGANATITATPCCGGAGSVKLAINCYPPEMGSSLVNAECSSAGCWCVNAGCLQGLVACIDYMVTQYDCTGAEVSYCETGMHQGSPCYGSTEGYHEVDCGTWGWGCPDPTYGCWTNQCGCGGASPCPCGGAIDVRSPAMKTAGCCPLNPLTGLPYD